MKTILNKTHRPLRVHLSGDKVLHLGPGKEGQISDHDVDHAGVTRLVEAGEIEIVGDGSPGAGGRGESSSRQADTHGHHPETSSHQHGDR